MTPGLALCQVMPLDSSTAAPEWIHVLPAGVITTIDGRGPYRVEDAQAVIDASLQSWNGKAVIDENHATDLAAPKGLPAPARGWMTELQARGDGIWAKVEWTGEGSKLVADRAYRGLSPAIMHQKDGRVLKILRASLINTPNLRGLAALHANQQHLEQHMDFMQKLRKALGLADDADESAILAACEKAKSPALQSRLTSIAKAVGLKDDAASETVLQAVTTLAGADVAKALQSQLAPIAKAAGLKDDADAAAVLQVVTTMAAGQTDAVKALQSELSTVTTNFNTLNKQIATDKATTFIDGAIQSGRVGVKPMREHYIAMHAADPARVEKEINAMPILTASGAQITPPKDSDGNITALNSEQKQACKLLGLAEADYLKTLQAEAAEDSQ